MAKKYIDIEMTGDVFKTVIPSFFHPENVIFFAHYFDMGYDRKSEDMGHFFEIVYLDGDEIKAEWGNPKYWEGIGEFIEKNGDKFARADNQGVLFNFFNKAMLSDLKIEEEEGHYSALDPELKKDVLIYKDKYRLGGLSIVPNLDFDKHLVKDYNSKWSKDPLDV